MARLRYALIGVWLVIVAAGSYFYFFQRAFIEAELHDALSVTSIVAAGVYLLFGSIRAFTLIPSTFLIVAGLPFFQPMPLFLLTIAGILVSSASIYWCSESLHLDELFERKHKSQVERVRRVLQRREMTIIIAWSFFPFAPTDVICYVCGVMKVDFAKFLLGVLIGEGAICAVYIFLGGYIL